MKTGKPFRQTLIENTNSRFDNLVDFLNSDFVFETNNGFEVDILRLVDKMNKKDRKVLLQYLEMKINL